MINSTGYHTSVSLFVTLTHSRSQESWTKFKTKRSLNLLYKFVSLFECESTEHCSCCCVFASEKHLRFECRDSGYIGEWWFRVTGGERAHRVGFIQGGERPSDPHCFHKQAQWFSQGNKILRGEKNRLSWFRTGTWFYLLVGQPGDWLSKCLTNRL